VDERIKRYEVELCRIETIEHADRPLTCALCWS